MPDPIQRRFGYGPVWPLLPVCSQNMAEQYMQDPTSSLRFISVFPKKAWIILCKNRPVSDLDGLVRVWPNASGSKPVSESSGPVSGRTQPSRYQFSHLQTLFRSSTDVIDDTVQNHPRSDLVLADCVRFWPNGSGPEPSRCARIIRPASG